MVDPNMQRNDHNSLLEGEAGRDKRLQVAATLRSIGEIDGISILEIVDTPRVADSFKLVSLKPHKRVGDDGDGVGPTSDWLRNLFQRHQVGGSYFVSFYEYAPQTWVKAELDASQNWLTPLWKRAGFHKGLCLMAADESRYLEIHIRSKDMNVLATREYIAPA